MIGPVKVAVLDEASALEHVATMIDNGDAQIVTFCNAHSVNLARKSKALCDAYDRSLVLNDGIGVDIARRITEGAAFPANLNGTDFTTRLLQHLAAPRTLYLLGSKPGVVGLAAEALAKLTPQHRVVGMRDGYFTAQEDVAVAKAITDSRPDIILLGMGQPRQEIWAAQHAAEMGALVMCVGAYLDFVAGVVPRAPPLLRAMRMEWMFRLMHEPKRLFTRYIIGNPRFLVGVLMDGRNLKR